MFGKSTKDLKEILISKSYVNDAKQAAAWELENRGIHTKFKPRTEPQIDPERIFLNEDSGNL